MKYSIIIPYRNREAHLEIMLPRLQEFFKGKDYEIIVSEQNDNDNFRIACVENIGFKYSTGDVIILQQVDYYPTDDVSYEVTDVPVLPARQGIF
jgi:glycosyltransferase involved in cell wall biosynthesis